MQPKTVLDRTETAYAQNIQYEQNQTRENPKYFINNRLQSPAMAPKIGSDPIDD
jgi:hypothetical protein